MKSEDRRAPNVPRVAMTTLVDICTQQGEVSPFQAQAANVSGRGMQVQTSYLPGVGEELVCRFNQDDKEILVEGRVAWRSEGADSGEFGIQFTALDADSAHILQSLGEAKEPAESSLLQSLEQEEELDGEVQEQFHDGARVKLHIDGLGAPMKACVHEGSSRKLRVGSALEFLKVGHPLEIEDLEGGGRRGAHVDTVNVVVNPSTSIPELVVQLRYEGVTPTPAPSQSLDYDDDAFEPLEQARSDSALSAKSPTHDREELSDGEAAPWEPAAEALRLRLGGAMASASQAASKAGGLLSVAARSAKESMNTVVEQKLRHSKAPEQKKIRQQTPGTKRRQTTRRPSRAAPSYLRSGIHDAGLAGNFRSQSSSRSKAPSAPAPARRRLSPGVIFGAAFLVLGGSAYALRSMSDTDVAVVAEAGASEASANTTANAGSSEPVVQAVAKAVKKKSPEGVLAEVPLFGVQAMAVKPAQQPASPAENVKSEKRAAAASVDDQTWDEEPAAEKVKPSKAWGKGRLYLPTIHRIRLDGVGSGLSGAVTAEGFTVVVAGRKAMESGKSIQKRDKRIMTVKTNNNARGATVKFEFRGPVPPYRVRLRKDFVEFLISAPEETIAKL